MAQNTPIFSHHLKADLWKSLDKYFFYFKSHLAPLLRGAQVDRFVRLTPRPMCEIRKATKTHRENHSLISSKHIEHTHCFRTHSRTVVRRRVKGLGNGKL